MSLRPEAVVLANGWTKRSSGQVKTASLVAATVGLAIGMQVGPAIASTVGSWNMQLKFQALNSDCCSRPPRADTQPAMALESFRFRSFPGRADGKVSWLSW